jgi:signal transduction histidine kinase/CheY-like chemotaxis protein
MQLRSLGLRARILAPVAMVALPALALVIYMNVDRRQREVDVVAQNALRLARLAAADQERLIEGSRQLLIAVSQSHDILVGNPEQCHAYLKRLLEQYGKSYTNIGVADPAGVVLCSGVSGPQLSVAGRSYFTLAVSDRTFAVGDYVVSRRTGAHSIGFGYPLIDSTGGVRGVVFSTLSLNDLNKSLTSENWPAGMTLTVTDRHRAIVARHPDADRWLGRTLPEDDIARLTTTDDVTTEQEEEGETRLVGFAAVRQPASTGLAVRVSMSKSAALLPVNRVMYEGLVALGIVAVLIMAGVKAASDRLILRPIGQLVKASQRLEQGDLTARAASSTTVPELSELGKAFDHMAAALEEREAARVRTELERKHLEQQYHQAQKMDAIGRLAGGVAHDFNNILTAVLGYAELLLSDPSMSATHRADISEIQKAAKSAATLTSQLLAFGRLEIVHPTVLDLNLLVQELGAMLGRLIGEDIEIGYGLAPDLDPVKADRGQIEQVLVNIIVNARDAMPNGGKITVETMNLDLDEGYANRNLSVVPGPHVVIAISDTGCGMSADVQEHLFEPFFTTKATGKGSGLGLATVYGIVQQNGGALSVYSEVGHGSTFKIYLPRAERESRAAAEPPIQASASTGSATILVVEDDGSIRELACRVLAGHGYAVLAASNGEDAKGLCEQHPGPIHLLLSDIVMPGMSGPAVAQLLKTIRPEMKVLYMSGYTDDAIVRHGVLVHDTPFLQKPFAPSRLAEKVVEVLAS